MVFRLMSKLTLLTARTPGKSLTRSLISSTFSVGIMDRLLNLTGGKLQPSPRQFKYFLSCELLDVGSELGIEPIRSIRLGHRPVGDVVGLVEELVGGLVSRAHFAIQNVHDEVDAAVGGLNRGQTHGQFERAIGIVNLFVFNFV